MAKRQLQNVPEWRNGRRGGLKNLCLRMCGFKSHLGHQFNQCKTMHLGDFMNLIQHIYSNIVLITGHYGCGKTNLCANMAVELAKAGIEVSIVDLDIVNPYFRISDYTLELEQLGVKMIAPNFAGTTLDTPSLSPQIQTVLEQAAYMSAMSAGSDLPSCDGELLQDRGCSCDSGSQNGEPQGDVSCDSESQRGTSQNGSLQSRIPCDIPQNFNSVVLVDVGGDPDGATALGRYKKIIQKCNYQMLYVVNQRRFQTSTVEETLELMCQIEQISGLNATHIVGNTHLMGNTTTDIIVESYEYSKNIALGTDLPLEFITSPRKLGQEVEQKIGDKIPVFLVDRYVGPTLA